MFRRYWDDFKKKYASELTRSSIIDNVERMINCGTFDSGYLYFECPNPICNNFHIQPFTCKSRFCPSCGKKYNDAVVFECMDCHIIVTHMTLTMSKNILEKMKT